MFGYIYETTNLVNGKKYIGKHKHDGFDNKYYGSGIALKRALNKYGKENFEVKIIEKIETNQDDLDLREMYWIKYFDAAKNKNYYNNSMGGKEEGWSGFNKAVKENGGLSKEHIKKLSESHKGKPSNRKGKHLSNEIKLKIIESNKNRRWVNKNNINKHIKSKELEKYLNNGWNFGRILNVKGTNHPMYGKHHTRETKEKLSKSHKGQIPWNKNKCNIYSEEILQKMRESKKGKKITESHKKKISEALKDKNKGKRWINDGIHNKFICKEELDSYLNNGWKLGQFTKKNIKR